MEDFLNTISPISDYMIVTKTIAAEILTKMVIISYNGNDTIYKHPTEDIYYVDRVKTHDLIYKNTYTIDEITHKLNILAGKIYYRTYLPRFEYYSSTKPIVSKIHVKEHLQTLVDSIIEKRKIHPDISINILLSGKPGTGKSSFVNYVATKLVKNVHILSTNKTSLDRNISVLSALSNEIILIPEIDKLVDVSGNLSDDYSPIYEFLDGSTSPTGSITIITCNDLNKIKKNKILTRPGRIHMTISFDLISLDEIKYIVNKYYPEYSDYTQFEQYIGKITQAEFNTAILYNYICDIPIEKLHKITSINYDKPVLGFYY